MEIDKTFWKRLQSFVAKVQVHDAMSEEEREYILHVAAEQASGVGGTNQLISGGRNGYRGGSAHKLKYN